MLPEHGDQDEDGRDEDKRQSALSGEAPGEGFDIDCAAVCTFFLVPTGKGCEDEEAEESKHYRHDAGRC